MSLASSLTVLNSTGGSFPLNLYQQATFAYNFVAPDVSLTYYGPSSSVGKCNSMGYWYTSNSDAAGNLISATVKKVDKAICTDKCTVALCGFVPVYTGSITLDEITYTGLPVRPDAATRVPLSDISASDGLLAPEDYFNFPDLQMLPSVAGAVVPVYNIPELASLNNSKPLILSRSSLVNIFMGFILTWNHTDIIADNSANPAVQAALQSLGSKSITMVVRSDSSGTSEVFVDGLSAMSPQGQAITATGPVASTDRSFYNHTIS